MGVLAESDGQGTDDAFVQVFSRNMPWVHTILPPLDPSQSGTETITSSQDADSNINHSPSNASPVACELPSDTQSGTLALPQEVGNNGGSSMSAISNGQPQVAAPMDTGQVRDSATAEASERWPALQEPSPLLQGNVIGNGDGNSPVPPVIAPPGGRPAAARQLEGSYSPARPANAADVTLPQDSTPVESPATGTSPQTPESLQGFTIAHSPIALSPVNPTGSAGHLPVSNSALQRLAAMEQSVHARVQAMRISPAPVIASPTLMPPHMVSPMSREAAPSSLTNTAANGGDADSRQVREIFCLVSPS